MACGYFVPAGTLGTAFPALVAGDRQQNKKSLTIACQGRKTFPRCHLASRFDPCPLRSACTLPDLDGVLPSHDTRCLSRAPSAVHLMHRFPPGSQLPGLSVGALYTVISASTVCIWLKMLYHTTRTFVNTQRVFLYTRIPHPFKLPPAGQCRPPCGDDSGTAKAPGFCRGQHAQSINSSLR